MITDTAALVVQPEQANTFRGCANCGAAVGGRHMIGCHEASKASKHLRDHLAEGDARSDCSFCINRRTGGGTGLRPQTPGTRTLRPMSPALQWDARTVARNIVNKLFDEAEVPTEKRQAINDRCDAFVERILREAVS